MTYFPPLSQMEMRVNFIRRTYLPITLMVWEEQSVSVSESGR